MSLPTSAEGWAIHLTRLLKAVHAAHGLPRVPVDVASIATEYSRQVFPTAPITMVEAANLSRGIEGMLIPNPSGNGEWGIICNASIQSRGRRNFTLAHELGHYLLHRALRPDGFECSPREMGDWRSGPGRLEAEANLFASYLLMPLDDFRVQLQNKKIDLNLMDMLAQRYSVSLTAAILKWLSITDQRAMIVVGREGFMDWSWSSRPLFQTGRVFRARQDVISMPRGCLALEEKTPEAARAGVRHPPGVWSPHESVREWTVTGLNDEMTISLLLFPSASPRPWEMSDWNDLETPDSFDHFVTQSCPF